MSQADLDKLEQNKTLLLQSLKSAYLFLEGAEKILDLKKGEGYAVAHPEQVAAFMLTVALDLHATRYGDLIGDLAESLGRLSGEL